MRADPDVEHVRAEGRFQDVAGFTGLSWERSKVPRLDPWLDMIGLQNLADQSDQRSASKAEVEKPGLSDFN